MVSEAEGMTLTHEYAENIVGVFVGMLLANSIPASPAIFTTAAFLP
jgi:hypothetical protein